MNKKIHYFALFCLFIFITSNFNTIIWAKNDGQGPQDKNQNNGHSNGSHNTPTQGTTPKQVPEVLGSTSKVYGFEIVSLDLPVELGINQNQNIDISIKNTSNFKWEKPGDNKVEITYHWVDSNGQYEVYRGDSTNLQKEVSVNETITQRFKFRAPEVPGFFKLKVDLINNENWFSNTCTNCNFVKDIKINGVVENNSIDGTVLINHGAKYANSLDFTLTVNASSFQPGSDNAAFIYEFAQGSSYPIDQIQSGTAYWGRWGKLSSIHDNSDIPFILSGDTKVGEKTVYVRLRSFKKQSDATPNDYGSAQYHYGRAEKTTGVIGSDTIFFDNVAPQGGVLINDGAFSTYNPTVNVKIWATDTIDNIVGSGLDKMRFAVNCNLSDPNSIKWGDWESIVPEKTSINLGNESHPNVCVQFRDLAENISQVYSDDIYYVIPQVNNNGEILGNTYNRLIGTPEDIYGGKSAKDLEKPRIQIKSIFDGGIRRTYVTNVFVPAPIISYIEVVNNNKQAIVHGVAIPKYTVATFEITYQVQYDDTCWFLGISYQCVKTREEFKTMDAPFEHVGLAFYEQTPWWWVGGDPEIGWLWNDNVSGQWSYTFNLNDPNQHNLNLDDIIYAKSKAWGKINTEIDGIGEFDYSVGAAQIVSGDSNHEKIISTLILIIEDEILKMGVTVSEDETKWTLLDVKNILDALKKLPSSYYSNGTMIVIKKLQGKDGCDIYSDGSFTGGYVTPVIPNTIFICSRSTATNSFDFSMQGTIIHEFTHNYQKVLSSENINSGMNVINNTSHVLYKYYDILFNTDSGHWKIDSSIVNEPSVPKKCTDYGEGQGTTNYPIFVSRYQCQTSLRINELPDAPKYVMPEEEMAETSKVYYLNPSLLIKQDNYNYKSPTNETFAGSLNRYTYFRDNFAK